MGGFVGRREELEMLERSFGEPSAFLVYGRRRIGKTALLRRFCEGKRHVYLMCQNSSRSDNLRYIAKSVSRFTGSPTGPYEDYGDALRDIGLICAEAPTVVVIDEYQWLASTDGAVSSSLQEFIDLSLPETKSMLILCGSSVGSMRAEGEDPDRPLYGRFRRVLALGPLTLRECAEFHPGMPDGDLLRLYLTVGGVPAYHERMRGATYRECVEEAFAYGGWAEDEASSLLRMEPACNRHAPAVLSAIGSGASRLRDVADRAGLDSSLCLKTLKALEAVGVVGRAVPMLGAPKSPAYRIDDYLLSFYFGVLSENRLIVENNPPAMAYGALEQTVSSHLGRMFEVYCEGLVARSYPVKELGKWWLDDSRRGVHEELDIVAKVYSGGRRRDLLVECKLTSKKAGIGEYRDLERRSRIAEAKDCRLMLISPSGFDEKLASLAEREGLLLAGMDEVFGRSPMPPLDGERGSVAGTSGAGKKEVVW